MVVYFGQNVLRITYFARCKHQPFETVLHQQGQLLDHALIFLQSDRSRQHDPTAGLRSGDIIDHVLHRVRFHLPTAYGRIGFSDPGVQQPQVIVNFGRRPHRRTRVARIDFLFHRNGRGDTRNEIHIRFFDLSQKLSGICRQALHIPPLPLREYRIERQRGFSRPRQARHHDQLVMRNLNLYIFEIMYPGALDMNILFHTIHSIDYMPTLRQALIV